MIQTANVLNVFYLLNADPFSLLPTSLLPNRLSCNSASGWVQPMGMLRQKMKRKEQGRGIIPLILFLDSHLNMAMFLKESHWLSRCSTLHSSFWLSKTSPPPIRSSLRVITPSLFLAMGFATHVGPLYPTYKFRNSPPSNFLCIFHLFLFGTLSDSATLLLTIPKN